MSELKQIKEKLQRMYGVSHEEPWIMILHKIGTDGLGMVANYLTLQEVRMSRSELAHQIKAMISAPEGSLTELETFLDDLIAKEQDNVKDQQ